MPFPVGALVLVMIPTALPVLERARAEIAAPMVLLVSARKATPASVDAVLRTTIALPAPSLMVAAMVPLTSCDPRKLFGPRVAAIPAIAVAGRLGASFAAVTEASASLAVPMP